MQVTSGMRNSQEGMRSRASGILFFAFFGAIWSVLGITAFEGIGRLITLVVALCVTIGLLWAAIFLLRTARHMPQMHSEDARKRGRQIGRTFGIVFATEIVAIIIVNAILSALHVGQLIIPAVAIIVGIHFLPLAPLFQMVAYYATGIALILIGAIAIIAIVASHSNMGSTLDLWYAFVGLGAALILWITSFVSIYQGLSQAHTNPAHDNG